MVLESGWIWVRGWFWEIGGFRGLGGFGEERMVFERFFGFGGFFEF